jgi:acyl-CoA reductase-like NAD-dependent aldehyde dehydrogenase
MDPNLRPDPENAGMLWGLLGILGGLLIAAGKKMLGRHESENDELVKEFRTHIAESGAQLGELRTRLTVLEDRKLVTLPELELAIEKALASAVKLFSPEHAAIAKQMSESIRDSKKETIEIVAECNKKVREDFKEDIKIVKADFTSVKAELTSMRADTMASMNMLGDLTRLLAKRRKVRVKQRTRNGGPHR